MEKIMLVDSHAHLQDRRYGENVSDVIKRAEDAGVARIVCCATGPEDWDRVKSLSHLYPQMIIPCFGVHPWYLDSVGEGWLEKLEQFLKEIPSGVGECGLDFAVDNCSRQMQEEVFKMQLALARRLKRPVTIHCRKAWDRLIAIVKEQGALPAEGLIHSYSGSPDMVKTIESLGLHISFSGAIANIHNKRGRKAIAEVSAERLLLETDSPDILPYFLREKSQLNEPAYLALFAESAAKLRNITVREISEITSKNAEQLFQEVIR